MKDKSVPYMVLCLFWLFIIFGHSMLPGNTSNQESLGFLAVMQIWIPRLTHSMLRKLAHFIEFGVLGFLVTGYLGQKNGMAAPLFACLADAVIDESIQYFVDGRYAAVRDIWMDFSGALLGILIMWGALSLFKKS